MAADGSPNDDARRKRLQKCFVHASKQAAANNFDYATNLFSDCVLGDKNNSAYWQSFFGNLRKKYNNNKKGVKLAKVRTGKERAAVKTCQYQKNWDGVFRHGHLLGGLAPVGPAAEHVSPPVRTSLLFGSGQLVGITDSQVSALAELDSEETARVMQDQPDAESVSGFKDALSSAVGRLRLLSRNKAAVPT